MGCTSSASSMAPANATEKNTTFSDGTNVKPEEKIDDMIDEETKAVIEHTVLPTCDTLDEPILLSQTNKSILETASQRIDKDVQTDSFRIDNGNTWNERFPLFREEEEKPPKLEEVVEQVVEMMNSGRGTSSARTSPEAEGAPQAEPDDACEPPPDSEHEQQTEIELSEEAISPSQSESSRATRWEALADVAAELPPSLAVDPLTGQIYTLK